MSYITFQPNLGGLPAMNVEMSADEGEPKALSFRVEYASSGELVAEYFIEDPGEILMFFEEVRKLETEYGAL